MQQSQQQQRGKQQSQQVQQSQDVDVSEKNELRKFVRKQVKQLEQKAKKAIFEGLPELYLDLQACFDSEPLLAPGAAQGGYERSEALFLFKNDSDSPLGLAVTREILSTFKPSETENVLLAASPDRGAQKLHNLAAKFIERLRDVAEPLLFWLQHLLPKNQENHNDPWSSFLIEILHKTNSIVEEFDDYSQDFIAYHQSRANIIKMIRKYATFDHYTQLQLLDFKEIHTIRATLQKLLTQVLVLYQSIGTGFKRIQNSGKSGAGVAGGVIM